MTKFKKQLLSVVAAGSLLASPLSVFAQTTLVISGNGSDSENEVRVSQENTTSVIQDNVAQINNYVSADANTGDNKAEDNTGGEVGIKTGDAKTKVTVDTAVNTNAASVDCCGTNGSTTVEISGNGTGSENEAKLKQENAITVWQTNVADVQNKVKADATTGDNKAEDNTGGDVSIETGDAKSIVGVSTTANVNQAMIGGSDSGRSVSLLISGNGSDSENEIKLGLLDALIVGQENVAMVDNHVYADADTGDNEAEDNTGGEVSIETGDAKVDISVDNMVNFNAADVDCGCMQDVLAKVTGNGTDSENEIKAYLDSELEAYQVNTALLDNHVDGDADTGDNEVEDSTAGVDPSDPSVETGDADSIIEVSNSGNSNSYGDMGEWELPEMPEFHFGFNISLSLSALLSLLGL